MCQDSPTWRRNFSWQWDSLPMPELLKFCPWLRDGGGRVQAWSQFCMSLRSCSRSHPIWLWDVDCICFLVMLRVKSKWQVLIVIHTTHVCICLCAYTCTLIPSLPLSSCMCVSLPNKHTSLCILRRLLEASPLPRAFILSWLRSPSIFQIASLARFLSSFPSWSLYHRNKTSYFPFLVIKLYDNIWRCCFKIRLSPYSKPWGAADRWAILKWASLAKWLGFEMVPDDCYQMLNIWK